MRVNAYKFTDAYTPSALVRALYQLLWAECQLARPWATERLLIYTHSYFWASVGGGAGGVITGCCDGGVTSGEVCGLGFAMGVIAGVVVVLGRCTAVGGLSRNVFLVGGCACPTMPHYAPLCIH